MFVKICGTTNLGDARVAGEAGADAVGFVFVPESRRQISAGDAGEISRAILGEYPAMERWGVFESRDAAEIVREARVAGLTGVQLHGGGGAALQQAVVRLAPELLVMPVVSWEIGAEDAAPRVRQSIQEFGEVARGSGAARVLVDSKLGAERGGTGLAFPWGEAAQALEGVRADVQLVLAGGLRPETVAEAVRMLSPWGVDVVSGVEAAPGRKDPDKVRSFAAAARSAASRR